MAAKKKQTGESSSSEAAIWTNISKNPVILGDGSTVGAGEQTTPEQAEFADGSLWEEHGILVSGAPVLMDDGADQIAALTSEIEVLRAQLVTAGSEKETLLADIEELKKQIPPKE
ncbi:hypothetical protein BK655_12285 [Pseudomonas brassicacearum]|uniref:hypothetical protein n=1 Tax=Pseudomonas brassicacearum TaxID=930166 RepID=UPI000F46A85B|nr:hypothetical protein [Pseudomonas brassicacearum]ROM84124.1 hypothetical protein BK655_12285 [Pseudomonas brassicacearum]